MDNQKAQEYLGTLLGKQLRVHTTDSRMFVGEFKCTDNECNVILSMAYEHRLSLSNPISTTRPKEGLVLPEDSLKGATARRFLGLIVVPGQHITKIEVEDR